MPVENLRDDNHRTAESRSTRDTNSSKNDALKGATLAFGKPVVKPKPPLGSKPSVGVLNSNNNTYNKSASATGVNDNYNNSNGAALAAATKVGSPARPVSSSASVSIPSSWSRTARARAESIGNPPLLKHPGLVSNITGSNGGGGTLERQSTGQQLRNQHSYLQLPHGGGPPPEPSKSPSLAAALAASRSVPTSPSRISQQQQQHRPLSPTKMINPSSYRSPTPIRSRSPDRDSSSEAALDTTPIPPTTALIGMFEKNAGPTATEKPVKKLARASTVRKPEAPPKPVLPVRPRTPPPPRSRPEIKAPTPVRAVQTAKTKTLLETQKPQPPPSRNKPTVTIPRPAKPPTPKPGPRDNGYESSDDESFVSASDYQPSFRATLQARRLNSPSTASVDSSAMIDSMANAIVASSLASSRAVSPTRPNINSNAFPPQPPPPRRHLFHNHHAKESSRTPSPAKPQGLKTTLRKTKPDDEIDENEKRRHRRGLVKKHPNKHHEGDRKRWRDAITERERKRYEAVWASNKGLFPSPYLNPEVSASSVCNLVVRDIYSRSRLNDDVLEEVYNLVDRHSNGRLQKEEFVVGLWLIDQRLKGRKLPPRVSESVWRSAGLLGDIKVRGAKGGKH